MYKVYIVPHFALMLVWVVVALVLDYRFLRNFRRGSKEEKTGLLRNIRSVSDRTEMPASFFLPLLGVLMIIEQTSWLRAGFMHGKIALALGAVAVYHVSRGTLRKMLGVLEKGETEEKLAGRYTMLRTVMILLLVGVVGIVVWNRQGFTTLYIIRDLMGMDY